MLGSFSAQFCLRGGKGNIFSLILQFLGGEGSVIFKAFSENEKKGKTPFPIGVFPFL